MKIISTISRNLCLLSILLLFLFSQSCVKEKRHEERKILTEEYYPYSDETSPSIEGNCGIIHQKDLVRGDGQIAGNALVYNDQKYFYVELSTFQGYYMWNAYLHVAKKYADFPLDQHNNPDIKHFEYSIIGKPMANMKKFRIPISKLQGASYIAVAVETKFLREEFNSNPVLAWVNGKVFGSSSKGRSFFYLRQTCREDEPNADYSIE